MIDSVVLRAQVFQDKKVSQRDVPQHELIAKKTNLVAMSVLTVLATLGAGLLIFGLVGSMLSPLSGAYLAAICIGSVLAGSSGIGLGAIFVNNALEKLRQNVLRKSELHNLGIVESPLTGVEILQLKQAVTDREYREIQIITDQGPQTVQVHPHFITEFFSSDYISPEYDFPGYNENILQYTNDVRLKNVLTEFYNRLKSLTPSQRCDVIKQFTSKFHQFIGNFGTDIVSPRILEYCQINKPFAAITPLTLEKRKYHVKALFDEDGGGVKIVGVLAGRYETYITTFDPHVPLPHPCVSQLNLCIDIRPNHEGIVESTWEGRVNILPGN